MLSDKILMSTSSDHDWQRIAAVESLDADRASEEQLLSYLGDPSFRVRRAAIQKAKCIAEPRSLIPKLLKNLENTENPGLKNASAALLAEIGSAASEPIVSSLRGLGAAGRKMAIEALGLIRGAEVRAALIAALDDSDRNVQAAVLEALGNLGGPDVLAALRHKLADSRTGDLLKIYILEALAQCRAVLPFAELRPFLAESKYQRSLMTLLSYCEDHNVVPYLVQGVCSRSSVTSQRALIALASALKKPLVAAKFVELRTNRAPIHDVALKYLTSDDGELHAAAVEILGTYADPNLAAQIFVASVNRPTLQNALEQMAEVGPAAVAHLVKNVHKSTPPLAEAVYALEGNQSPLQMSTSEFAAIRDLICERCGILFSDDMKFVLERRLLPRLTARQLRSFSDYYDLMKKADAQGEEFLEVIERVTTNETYFFREAHQLQALSEEVVPRLMETRANSELRIWSAGCSTGEEPYSIVMHLLESGNVGFGPIRVFASDISARVLKIAQAGVFRESSLRVTPPTIVDKYFQKRLNGYVLDEKVMSMVQFRRHNLIDATEVTFDAPFDVIFCRNVMIYFPNHIRRLLLESFFELLLPGGFLLLGHAETLMQGLNKYEMVALAHDMVFRKPIESHD